MRAAVLVVFAAACNQVYGLDPTKLDNLEPNDCSNILFGQTRRLTQFDGSPAEFDPQLSADGLELWYVIRRDSDGLLEIYRATRTDRTRDFTTSDTPLMLLEQTSTLDPSMTADGLRLMFLQQQNGRVHEAVRSDPKSPDFDLGIRITQGFTQWAADGITSFDISWDGLRIYYTADPDPAAPTGELWTASRAMRDQLFTNHALQFVGARFPSISPDELEIFYNREGDPPEASPVFRRRRASRDAPFGDPEPVLDHGGDPDVSPDATTLIVVDDGLAILERVCPDE